MESKLPRPHTDPLFRISSNNPKIQCFKFWPKNPCTFSRIRIHTVKVGLSMIFSFFHHFISKFPLNLQQNLTFFGPDFVPQCSPSKFWLRQIQNHVPKHARAQNLAQINVFRLQDTFKALKWAKNEPKGSKQQFPSTLRAKFS